MYGRRNKLCLKSVAMFFGDALWCHVLFHFRLLMTIEMLATMYS